MVENCQKLKISDFMKTCKVELKRLILDLEIQSMGVKIDLSTSKTSFDGVRFWFTCPECKKKIGVLFTHPVTEKVGCRKCLNLEYKKRRYKGMLEME